MDRFPIEGILNLLEQENNFVFLETTKPDTENFLSYVLLRPQRVITTFKADELDDCFAQLHTALNRGYYVAGFLSYEAGSVFEEKLAPRQTFDFPLLWFGVYQEPLIYDHRKQGFSGCSPGAKRLIKRIVSCKVYQRREYALKNIRPNLSPAAYARAITRIKDLIAQGYTYQVNYTFKLKFSFSGSPAALYLNLRNNQSVAYSALIKAGHLDILSFSPELFFRKKGRSVLTRPMKGTTQRGRDLEEDRENIVQLKNCPKNRSENVMIVDLLRNDLGRISTTGSVRVPNLFNVERYETLFQMTSDIKSRLLPSCLAFDIFRHIFPSGSVTGAPKIKTMEIIRELEEEPRNVYTGSIGLFSPDHSGTFNVAIRTLLINSQTGAGEMGVGSGIVYDSDARSEYSECRLKTDFLVKKMKGFQLIETLLWQPARGYLFLKLHLERLSSSAEYFNFIYKEKYILHRLRGLAKRLPQRASRVRLFLFKNGEVKLETSLLRPIMDKKPKVFLSAKKTQIQNPFLYHKTTNRKIYDAEYARCKRLGFYDAVFTNARGEITEGAISNVFIKRNGCFYTPPLECGLLNGVYRQYLISAKKHPVREKLLFPADLLNSEEIYLSNSVRGLVRVYLQKI